MHAAAPPRAAQRGKAAVLVAIAVAAIAAVAGAYYLIAVYLPQQKRGPARDELAAWEKRLAEARACLLGDAPGSTATREAIAIRELSPDPWNRSTCTQLISRLSRGETEDTGMPAVEEAWRELERAAGTVGAAFLAHVDPMGEPVKDRKPDRLPASLDELDAAHRKLRAALDLPPPPARAAGKPLPAAAVVPLRDGDRPIRALTGWAVPSMGAVQAFASAEGRELQLTLVPGAGPPAVKAVSGGTIRAVPDGAWGAAARTAPVSPDVTVNVLAIGPIDDAGTPPALDPGDPRKSKRAIVLDGSVQVHAAVGPADNGLVVAHERKYDEEDGWRSALVVVRAQAGKLAADKPIAIGELTYAVDPAGRALAVYTDAGKLRGFVARDATSRKELDLGAGVPALSCLTEKRGWVSKVEGGDEDDDAAPLVSIDLETGAVTPHAGEPHGLLACTAGAALLQRRNAAHFLVCTEQCRVAVLPGMRPSRFAALAGDEVVSVAHRDRVLGVWREKGPPAYHALPKPLVSIVLALSDGKVIDVVAETEEGLAIVRVPAR